jgi:hypothetical protein
LNEKFSDSVEDEELELRMARYEDLIERQPLLISNVRLRQNPHNVNEWHSRIKLFDDNPKRVRTDNFSFHHIQQRDRETERERKEGQRRRML